MRQIGQLPRLASYPASEIWSQVAARLKGESAAEAEPVGLKVPEWRSLSQPATSGTTHDFKITPVAVPAGYEAYLQQVVLAERLRIVQSLIGFTRIESPDDATAGYMPADEQINSAPLTRRPATWAPAVEVRGEGLFLQFHEETIDAWLSKPTSIELDRRFATAHRRWREARRIPHPAQGYPGLRYVLLHSFAHALIRRLTLECGYTASSIRERIYSLPPTADDGPMAGILLYTSAHDSEGTLGGLVSLGQPELFGHHLDAALEEMHYCTSDPLCAEHTTVYDTTLHQAACHACLFLPETACERGNKYLDRSVLVSTVGDETLAFFS